MSETVRRVCPHCGIWIFSREEYATRAEIRHMQRFHPDIINERLESAGFVQDEEGEWHDTLAAED